MSFTRGVRSKKYVTEEKIRRIIFCDELYERVSKRFFYTRTLRALYRRYDATFVPRTPLYRLLFARRSFPPLRLVNGTVEKNGFVRTCPGWHIICNVPTHPSERNIFPVRFNGGTVKKDAYIRSNVFLFLSARCSNGM